MVPKYKYKVQQSCFEYKNLGEYGSSKLFSSTFHFVKVLLTQTVSGSLFHSTLEVSHRNRSSFSFLCSFHSGTLFK